MGRVKTSLQQKDDHYEDRGSEKTDTYRKKSSWRNDRPTIEKNILHYFTNMDRKIEVT